MPPTSWWRRIRPAAAAGRAESSSTRAIIVFREGLEAVLIFAAVTASFVGAQQGQRRSRSSLGAGRAFVATVVTWFARRRRCSTPRRRSARGWRRSPASSRSSSCSSSCNWFVHKVYWSQWIGRHHRQRRTLLGAHRRRCDRSGLVALGFTERLPRGLRGRARSCRTSQLQAGHRARCSRASRSASPPPRSSASLTFWLHHKLPYSRMLVLTGVLLGVVLVVMIGGTALTLQELGWLPAARRCRSACPSWLGAWFEIYATWETIARQLLAARLRRRLLRRSPPWTSASWPRARVARRPPRPALCAPERPRSA